MNSSRQTDTLIEIAGNQDDDEKAFLRKILNFHQSGGDINQEIYSDKRQLIHVAAGGGMSEVVRWLFENGADLEARDTYGMTPLLYAIYHDTDSKMQHGLDIDFQHTRRILDLGANHKAANNEGLTMEKIAKMYGRKMYALFKQEFESIL